MNKLISHLEAVSLGHWSHLHSVRTRENQPWCMAGSGTAHNAPHTHFDSCKTTQHLRFLRTLGLSINSTANQHSIHNRVPSTDFQIGIMMSHLHDMLTLTWTAVPVLGFFSISSIYSVDQCKGVYDRSLPTESRTCPVLNLLWLHSYWLSLLRAVMWLCWSKQAPSHRHIPIRSPGVSQEAGGGGNSPTSTTLWKPAKSYTLLLQIQFPSTSRHVQAQSFAL